jgi:membrane protein
MGTDSPALYMQPPSRAAQIAGLLRRAAVQTYQDNCLGIAKGVAFSGLLAFFPVLSSLVAISVYVDAESVTKLILRLLFEAAPPGLEESVAPHLASAGSKPIGLLIFASLFAFWGASEVVTSLMDGFNAAYRVAVNRSWGRARLVAFGLVFTSVLPVIAASAAILLGTRVEEWLGYELGLLPEGTRLRGWVAIAGNVIRSLTAAGTMVLVTSCLYYFGPNRKQSFRNVWPGAVVAMMLWLPATFIFAWYASNIARYNVVYGSLGGGIALLVWLYLISVIALLGCEYNVARERLIRSRQSALANPR